MFGMAFVSTSIEYARTGYSRCCSTSKVLELEWSFGNVEMAEE